MTDVPVKYADAPERDADPRGPDAPEKHLEKALRGPQEEEVLEPHLATREPYRHRGAIKATVAAPFIVPQFLTVNYDPGRGGYGIAGVVIHTEVGNNDSSYSRFVQPGQASAHYGVAYDGSGARQWVNEANTAWHCGRYLPDAGHMGNRNSIGIEHEDRGQYNSPRPDALYECSAQLVAWILSRYGLPANHDTVRGECGHREVSINGTACPDSLDVDRIIARAAQIMAPAPPVVPEWQKNLKPEAFTVTALAKSVPVHDLVTGADVGLVAAGASFTSAYVTTVGGVAYRVTEYGKTHGTGVRTADIVPVAPPKPEWYVNAKPNHRTFQLSQPIPYVDLTTGKDTGQVLAAGPLVTDYDTAAAGRAYYMTTYSFTRNVPHGFRVTDVDFVTKPVPKPPDPGPPTPPPGALDWLGKLVDWLRSLFGQK